MGDTLSCPECDHEVESADDLERQEAPEVEVEDDNSLKLYESRDLFLCTDCRKPLGVTRS